MAIDVAPPLAECIRGIRGPFVSLWPGAGGRANGEGDLGALAELGSQMMFARRVDDRLRLAAHAVSAHLSRPVAAGLREGGGSIHGLVWLGIPDDRREDLCRAMVRLARRTGSADGEARVVRSSLPDMSLTMVTGGTASILVVDAPESAAPFLQAVGGVVASAVATGATSDAEMGMNLAWTAHELETPLMTVRTAMEQAMLSRRSTERRGFLERGLRELEELSEVTDSLLRSRGGASELERSPAELGREARAMLSTVTTDRDGREIRVIAPEPVWASVDPVQFRIAVMNLVRNALRHGGTGSISVRVLREGQDAVIAVEDEGHGVPESARDRIFEPFVSASDSGATSGSGLGLFICKRIVEHHDGTLAMEDRDGGNAFVIRIPWDDGKGEPPSAS